MSAKSAKTNRTRQMAAQALKDLEATIDANRSLPATASYIPVNVKTFNLVHFLLIELNTGAAQ